MTNLLIYVVLLILEAFALVFGIVLIVASEGGDGSWTGLFLSAASILMITWTFVRLVRQNRLVQEEARQQAERNADTILMRWESNGRSVLLTHQSLFVDGSHHEFKGAFEYLSRIDWDPEKKEIIFWIQSRVVDAELKVALWVEEKDLATMQASVTLLREKFGI